MGQSARVDGGRLQRARQARAPRARARAAVGAASRAGRAGPAAVRPDGGRARSGETRAGGGAAHVARPARRLEWAVMWRLVLRARSFAGSRLRSCAIRSSTIWTKRSRADRTRPE